MAKGGRSGILNGAAEQIVKYYVRVHLDIHLQHTLFFPAVHGKNAVGRHAFQRLAVIVILLVYAFSLSALFGNYGAEALSQTAYFLAVIGVVGNLLGNNIPRSLQSVLRTLNAFFRINKVKRRRLDVRVVIGAHFKNKLRQRLQPPLSGNACAGAPLGTVGTVNIVHLGDG